MGYTQPVFQPGARYRAKKSFKSGPTSTFSAGEVLVFERDTYSHYDNAFVYVFRSSGGEEKEWWLTEGEPKESWHEYFEQL